MANCVRACACVRASLSLSLSLCVCVCRTNKCYLYQRVYYRLNVYSLLDDKEYLETGFMDCTGCFDCYIINS